MTPVLRKVNHKVWKYTALDKYEGKLTGLVNAKNYQDAEYEAEIELSERGCSRIQEIDVEEYKNLDT